MITVGGVPVVRGRPPRQPRGRPAVAVAITEHESRSNRSATRSAPRRSEPNRGGGRRGEVASSLRLTPIDRRRTAAHPARSRPVPNRRPRTGATEPTCRNGSRRAGRTVVGSTATERTQAGTTIEAVNSLRWHKFRRTAIGASRAHRAASGPSRTGVRVRLARGFVGATPATDGRSGGNASGQTGTRSSPNPGTAPPVRFPLAIATSRGLTAATGDATIGPEGGERRGPSPLPARSHEAAVMTTRDAPQRPDRRRFLGAGIGLLTAAATGGMATPAAGERLVAGIDREVIFPGRTDGVTWFHPRPCMVPADGGPLALMTLQSIGGSDVFGPVHWSASADLGRTWSEPVPIAGLGRRDLEGDRQVGVCDVVPEYHPTTRSVLAVGHNVYYEGGTLARPQGPSLARLRRPRAGRPLVGPPAAGVGRSASDRHLHLRLLAAGHARRRRRARPALVRGRGYAPRGRHRPLFLRRPGTPHPRGRPPNSPARAAGGSSSRRSPGSTAGST